MISVGRRRDGGELLGFEEGGMEEDNELEEGEACDDAIVDPDIALSYIDEKLHDVLGHIQKEFEVGASSDNLRAKYGGYGSFLPVRERSPSILVQSQSPSKVTNSTPARLPHSLLAEGQRKNHSTINGSSVPMANHLSTASPADNVGNKNSQESVNRGRKSLTNSCTSGSFSDDGVEKKLKVRLKVGRDNSLGRNNAAIYSGLGLDISSSSSMEESPYSDGGISPDYHLHHMSDESPRTILQAMTCFDLPRGSFLSPLQSKLLTLTEKIRPSEKTDQKRMNFEEIREASGLALQPRDTSVHMPKRLKLIDKKDNLRDIRNPNGMDSICTIMDRDIDIETPAGQEIINDVLSIPLLSSCGRNHVTEGYAAEQLASSSSRIIGASNEVKNREQLGAQDAASDNTEVTEFIEMNGAGNLASKLKQVKGKGKLESSRSKKPSESSTIDDHRYIAMTSDNMFPERAVDVGEKVMKGKDFYVEQHKRVGQEQQHDMPSSAEFLADQINNKTSASHKGKDKRHGHHERFNKAEKKSKSKSHQRFGDNTYKESSDVMRNSTANGRSSGQLCGQDKLLSVENDIVSATPKQEIGEMPDNGKLDGHFISGAHVNGPTSAHSHNAMAPSEASTQLPVSIIEENWVECEKCLKWRLLPQGTTSASLPKRWKCGLLYWLPGMNSCDISEEETTKAARAMHQPLVPATGISEVLPVVNTFIADQKHNNKVPEKVKKKKSHPKDGARFSAGSTKKDELSAVKGENLTEGDPYIHETNLSSKKLGEVEGKLEDLRQKKHDSGQKDVRCYSDGGDLVVKSQSSSKSVKKRESEHDEWRKSKKELKHQHYYEKDFDSGYDRALSAAEKFSPMNLLEKKSQKCNNTIKGKNDLRENRFMLSKKIKDEKQEFEKDTKIYFDHSGMERHDGYELSDTKRVQRGSQESQNFPFHMSRSPENVLNVAPEASRRNHTLKEKKMNTVKPEEIMHKGESRGDEGIFCAGKERLSEHCKNPSSGQVMNSDLGARTRELPCTESFMPSASGSNFRSTKKSKGSYHEAKDSLRESISFSPKKMPIRASNFDRKIMMQDEVLNADTATAEKGKKCVGSECNMPRKSKLKSSGSTPQQYLGNHEAGEFGSSGVDMKEMFQLPCSQVSDGMDVRQNFQNQIPSSGGADSMKTAKVKQSTDTEHPSDYSDGHGRIYDHQSVDNPNIHKSGKSSSLLPDEKHKNHKTVCSGRMFDILTENNGESHSKHISCDYKDGQVHVSSSLEVLKPEEYEVQEREKHHLSGKRETSIANGSTCRMGTYPHSVTHENSNPDDHCKRINRQKPFDSKTVGGRVNGSNSSHLADDKQDFRYQDSQVACSSGMNGDIKKSVTKRKNSDFGNGDVPQNNLKQTTNDTPSPLRKESNSHAHTTLKEARDLKHKANRLKSEGLEVESRGLYFEAALKFLDCASLLEPPNFDSLKQGEAIQSMQMYSDTARLCEFCAYECERSKEMAYAALAYKCVEAAYFKAAYYKSPATSKDRQELQTCLQIGSLGESPSSSASDIENLNNQGLGKASSARDTNSPQVTGNHIVAARSHAQLTRVFHYTNETICAFEASRKSQIAIAAASANPGVGCTDGIASVRRVLDFNFHNIKELIRLVRLSMEALGR